MIFRGKFEDIVFEFGVVDNAKCTVIICDGLPSVPKQKELLTYLNNHGCNVFYPRYRGTWESGGEFLAQSPSNDIIDFVEFVKMGEITELYGNKTFSVKGPIHLIGSSFGGSVALSSVDDSNVDKIVVFSPIIDFKLQNNNGTEQDLNLLGKFITKAFGNGYRYKNENWELMVSGKLFNPPEMIESNRTKDILIAYDLLDDTIDYQKIIDYSSKNNIKNILSENTGHLSFSKIPQNIWAQVFDFLFSDKN